MLSPSLDVSMNNPEIKEMAHLDPFLKIDIAKMAANAFVRATTLNLNNIVLFMAILMNYQNLVYL